MTIIKTDVTILSTSISKDLLNNYLDYQVIEDNFHKNDLLKYKKVIFFNILNNLDEDEIKQIFSYLKENNILFVNITNNVELTL